MHLSYSPTAEMVGHEIIAAMASEDRHIVASMSYWHDTAFCSAGEVVPGHCYLDTAITITDSEGTCTVYAERFDAAHFGNDARLVNVAALLACSFQFIDRCSALGIDSGKVADALKRPLRSAAADAAGAGEV